MAAALLMGVGLTNSQQAMAQDNQLQIQTYANPYAGIVRNPLFHPDTEDYWYAVGEAVGMMDDDPGELKLDALSNAQNQIRQKMSHVYQGIVKNYARTVGNSKGRSRQNKLERGGKQIIDAVVNNTDSYDEAQRIDAKGRVTQYAAIKISKKEVAKKIKEFVSKNEDEEISKNSDKFMQELDEQFKKTKDEEAE